MGLCVFSWPISLVMIIIIKSEVWTISYCLGLGHETMVCILCVYVLMESLSYDKLMINFDMSPM